MVVLQIHQECSWVDFHKKATDTLWTKSFRIFISSEMKHIPFTTSKYRKRRYHVVKKRRIDKVGQKYKGKKESQYSPLHFKQVLWKQIQKWLQWISFICHFNFTFLSLFIYFFTQKQRPPAGPLSCVSLWVPQDQRSRLGQFIESSVFPLQGPHGYFPSMIQEFGVKGGKGGLWLLQVKVELKPEIGALVWE